MGKNGKTQQGFVAIVATLMIMGILALLTVGFSYATRQAQRRTLDDQLNSQAFYAAESGVNDAIAELQLDPTISKNTCGGGSFPYNIDAAANIRYTCLLINSQVPSLVYDSVPVVGTDEPITTELTLPSAAGSIEIAWDSYQTGLPLPTAAYNGTNDVLAPATGWGNRVGMMRVDLVPISALDRASMVNNSYTFFLYPSTAASPTANNIGVANGSAGQGGTLAVQCNNPGTYRCVGYVRPSGLHTRYQVRLYAYYTTVRTQLIFRPNTNNTGSPLMIGGAQAMIDSTGEASGVFRRIQVRVPLNPVIGWHPESALVTADSICKRVVGAPPSGTGTGGSVVVMPGGASDPACEIFSP